MDESTTGNDPSKTGVEETLPAEPGQKPADEHSDANSGGETHEGAKGGEDEGAGDGKPTGGASDQDDEGFDKFAKSQGFDPATLTDGERRALKIARDNQRDFHKKRQEEAEALRDSLSDLHDPDRAAEGVDDEYEKREARRDAEIAQLRQYQRVNEFFTQNPEARQYEAEMNRLVLEEKEKYGLESAIFLSRNLDRLYKLARADSSDPSKLRDEGRRQEREELRRKQEGSADAGSASVSSGRSSAKVDQQWIDEVYDPSNAEHRKMLDAYLAGS